MQQNNKENNDALNKLFGNDLLLPESAAESHELIQKQLYHNSGNNAPNDGRRDSSLQPQPRRSSQRRVSFAAMAHVHTFDESTSRPSLSKADNPDPSADKQPVVIDKKSSVQIVKEEENEDCMLVDDMLESEEEQDAMLPMVQSQQLPTADPHRRDSSQMDFTECLGGLIEESQLTTVLPSSSIVTASDNTTVVFINPKTKLPKQQEQRKQDDEEGAPMDLTKAFPTHAISEVENKTTAVNGNASEDTMQFTEVFLPNQRSSISPFLVNHENNEDPDDKDDDRPMMDTVKNTPKERNASNLEGGALLMSSPVVVSVPVVKAFLGACGIRFLDSTASLARRDTVVGRAPRESGWGTGIQERLLRAAYAHSVGEVDLAWLQQVMQSLHDTLVIPLSIRVGAVEDRLTRHVPQVILDCLQRPTNSPATSLVAIEGVPGEVSQRMRAMRSVARLHARQAWYEWRTGREEAHAHALQALHSALLQVNTHTKNLTSNHPHPLLFLSSLSFALRRNGSGEARISGKTRRH